MHNTSIELFHHEKKDAHSMAMSAEPVKNTPSTFLNMESGAEIARQMDQDILLTRAMGGLFCEHPDLRQVQQVLDVCSGPGGWALEMAFVYRNLEVTGIDKNRNMVDYARAQARVQGLENAFFRVMDVTELLQFPDNTFDIVNARFISSFLTVEDWPSVVRELTRVTKPGGIVRLTEFDEPGVSNSPAHERMKQLYGLALKRTGQSFHPLREGTHCCITPMLERFLSDAGCLYICEQAHVVNYSSGKRAAVGNYENLKVVYKLGQPFLIAAGVATQEQLDDLYEQMLLEMLSEDFRAIWYFLSVWGHKPE
jgi:ubiquinone/menaquinone biosynthesis C-methylase UbiE